MLESADRRGLLVQSANSCARRRNGGSAALTISSIGASGDFAQTNTCGGALAAGGTCSLAVTFTPTAAGERTGAVTIADNASNSPQTVGLTGSGISAAGGTPAGT